MSAGAERNAEPAAGAPLPDDPDAVPLPDDRAVEAGGDAGTAALPAALPQGESSEACSPAGEDLLKGGEGVQRDPAQLLDPEPYRCARIHASQILHRPG